MLHASFPRSVALTQLRFTSFAVINLRRDLHPQECAHAGRTKQNRTLYTEGSALSKLQIDRLFSLRGTSQGGTCLIQEWQHRDHTPMKTQHHLERGECKLQKS